MVEQESSSLKWRFDINVLRLIGRELISDRVTAVYELVKNCYDANAREVTVQFLSKDQKGIVVKDDGLGMTFEDIRDKWMVVGTDSKRSEQFSPEPFRRRYVGEKGIGRFATDKLGEKLLIRTKKKGHNFWLIVEIIWSDYKPVTTEDGKIQLFTDVENNYWVEETSDLGEEGTSLIITDLYDIWTSKDLERLNRELSKFVSPFYGHKTPFKIFLDSDEHAEFKRFEVRSAAIELASHSADIGYGLDEKTGEYYQESLLFNDITGQIYTVKIPEPSFGFVKMKLYFFNTEAKLKYNRIHPNKEDRIDGIRVYRDGIIATPFAEYEDDPMRRRDILGIDKRLWQDTFTRIGTREVIGYVEITKEENPAIVEATNRQDFVDTPEYRAFKKFIIEQLDVFSKVKIYERERKKLLNQKGYTKAIAELRGTTEIIKEIEQKNPQLALELTPLKEQLESALQASKANFEEQKKMHEEFLRRENIYFSLMSLQDYAINLAHAVRTRVGSILRMAEFFVDHYPNPKYDNLFKEYATQIYTDMVTLNQVTDFMLSYASSNLEFEDLNLKKLMTSIFKVYDLTFEKEGIQPQIEVQGNITLHANRKFFEEIIQNLISNSIKALKGRDNKIIKFSGFAENDQYVFYFSDNGPGIAFEKRDKIFDLYYTDTAKEGGGGVGLWIVKTRISSLKGTVELVDNEFKPEGATFKITLPFQKNLPE